MKKEKSTVIERKKGEPITLKTNLENVPISPKLNNFKSLSVSELINQPETIVKKFSILSFANSMRKGILNTSSIIIGDLNRTEADLTPFNTMEVLSETSFTSGPLESSRSTYSTKSNKSNNSNKTSRTTNNNTFKMLVREDYSGYIQILKRIYPSFKFNHYNRISNEYFEYYKKYGEEGDINNRNFAIRGYTGDTNKIKKDKGEYKKSNLLDILGVQENIATDPKIFKIKPDFLSRKDPYELKMIKEDLSFKTGVIDKELNHILESEANTLYNYIENNYDLNNKINEFSNKIKSDLEFQKIISKKYIANSAKLILKENKKKQTQRLLKPLKLLNELGKCMKQLELIAFSENDNKIKQISDSTNVAKEKIKLLKKFNLNTQKSSLFQEINNKIKIYENQGELKLNDQLAHNFENLINLCFIYSKNDEIKNNVAGGSGNENKKNYNLEIDKESLKFIIINDNDYELINEKENIYVKYLLIYNNIKVKNKIYKLLISILDMFDIIIKDNMDVFSIVDLFKNVFKKIISKNFEIIEKIPVDKLTGIEILSNCYSIIFSNFAYIIQLIQTNFGLNGKKIFSDVIDMMKNEMDELVKALVLAYLHEKMFDNENEWQNFLRAVKETKNISNIYFQNSKLKWNEMTLNLYQDYLSSFFEIKSKELTEAYNELLWDQITNINEKYQLMFDVLYTNQDINELEIDIDKIIVISDTENSENNSEGKKEFLVLKNENNENDKNHKISKFSYSFIKYIYEYLVVYVNIPNKNLKDNIINKIMKVTKDILNFSKDIIINNETGKINNIKQITEKETALYFSDLIVIENCIKNFMNVKSDNDLYNCVKEVSDIFDSLKNTCFDIITQLVTEVSTSFIREFNTLNFNNYKTFQNAKEYNSYIKKLTPLKRLYDNIGNAFSEENIKKIFKKVFEDMFNQFKQSVTNKGIIEKDDQLKQFRNEMNYIKKVFKLFNMIDCSKQKEIIDELSIKVNPNKLPKKKKKTKKEKEDDNAD